EELAAGEHGDGGCDVFGLAPAADGREAFGDELVVLFLDGGGHVAGDDAGADFIDVDFVLGQAVGEEPGHHLHGGFGHAVVGAVGGDGVGGDGRDVDDRAARDFRGINEGDHLTGGGLGEEERAFEIGGANGVPALLGGFEQVFAADRGNAGVVDEAIEPAEVL